MKNLICLSFLIILLGCSGSQRLVTTQVNQRYTNISFTPGFAQINDIDGLMISVTPIDAASINRETFEAAAQDGKYENEMARLSHERDTGTQGSKRERALMQAKLHAVEEVEKLEQTNQIPALTAYYLKMRIWNGKEHGRDGSEITSLSINENFYDGYNPYKINNRYLSVFKVTLENQSNEVKRIKLSDFQVLNGENLLYPLGYDYFEKNHDKNPQLIQNIYRMNMPDELVITPNQRITKYYSVPPIDANSKKLQVQLLNQSRLIAFDFEVSREEIVKNHLMEKFFISNRNSTDILYYAVSFSNGITFATKDASFFVSTENKKHPVNIYAVSIDTYNYKTRIISKKNILLNNQDKNVISFIERNASGWDITPGGINLRRKSK